jgi:hypothetical protein
MSTPTPTSHETTVRGSSRNATHEHRNTVYPVYLYDAQDGWDVLAQQRVHIDVLLANPVFLRHTSSTLATSERCEEGRAILAWQLVPAWRYV